MQFVYKILLLLFFAGAGLYAGAQSTDTIPAKGTVLPEKKDSVTHKADTAIAKKAVEKPKRKKDVYVDTVARKDPRYRNPGKAAFRSAVLPGWGQVYNKRIWKVPIVYAGLGITAGIFVDNLIWYKRFRYAVKVAYNIQAGTDSLTGPNFAKVYKDLKDPFFLSYGINLSGLQSNRSQFRQSVDYSAVFFLIAWALNVVDATVDAHLSTFDISPKLTLRIEPPPIDVYNKAGFAVVLRFK